MDGKWMGGTQRRRRRGHRKLPRRQTEFIRGEHSDPRCVCPRCLATRDAVKRHKAGLPRGDYHQNTKDPHRVMRVDPNGQRFELLKDGTEKAIPFILRSSSPSSMNGWTISTSDPNVSNLEIVETWCTDGAPGDVPFPGFRFKFDYANEDCEEECTEVCATFGSGDGCGVDVCGCLNVPKTLYATVSGDYSGVVPLVWNGSSHVG